MTSPLALLKAAVLLLALVCLPVAFVLGFCLITWIGVALGLAVGMIGCGPLLWCIGDERCSTRQVWLGKGLLGLGLVMGAGLVMQAPDGHTPETARMHSRYADGGWHYLRFGFANVLPEIDQIHLGYAAAMKFDGFFTREQKLELATMTDAIYSEMERDAEFSACGSALGAIYDEVTFSEFRHGHYFHYIPPQLDRAKPAPALVFLHGSGGNFKAYIWLLSKVADQTGSTVIAPTFGLGNWEKRGAYEAITAAIRDADKHAAIDPASIHLMGLSNGGKGVCLAESARGPRFASIILLSAVLHAQIQPALLAKRLANRPALILSGRNDVRVPWSYVDDYAVKLEKGGMQVTKRAFDGQDHFLFFRRQNEIFDEIQRWMKR
ncbi:MAG: alpha/beta fold hydrolase [Verrucomicrobiaceae bacterium]|nr:alpha/beta fold hydrolase [Verrucomicrobiaceae bacterium]